MLKPNDPAKTGIIIEFKRVYDNEKPEQVLSQALKQIEEKSYTAELEDAGIKKSLKIAIAFRGKELWMDSSNAWQAGLRMRLRGYKDEQKE